MSDEVFHKILNNTATETEKYEFFGSLESNPLLREEFQQYKNLFVLSNLKSEGCLKQQNESFSKFWYKVNTNTESRSVYLFMRYAAIFIFASLLTFTADYFLNGGKIGSSKQHIEYSSVKGSVSTIHLEDGSAIWLSSGTNLVIDKNGKGETIAHLNGEAYFDLVADKDRNFIVDLGNFKVKDIGTKFNIRAYQSETKIMATLVSGQIDLVKESGESFLTVKPGELVNYDKSNQKMTVIQQDPSVITAWKDGKFVFIDKTLQEICTELENWYNVEIQIEDQELASTRYTSLVKRTTTVQMVLKILAFTDHIKYEITDKKEGKDLIRIRK